jgi:LacI family transcriptional regulator
MTRNARSKPAADAPPAEAGARPAVSISAVAQRAGVSIATVSRVTNGVANKASPATVARVQEAIAALGYRPVGAGRALRRRESRLVAVLAANLANPAMAAIAAAAEVALRNAGYVMVLCDTHDEPDLQDEYLLEMRAQYACGLVLLGAVDSPVLRQFNASQEPLIFVNRRNPVPGGQGRYVGIDHEQAGRDVANWFADSQMQSIALIHARLASSATAGRVQGFREQLATRGISVPSARIQTLKSADHLQIGYTAMKKILGARLPEAVFCTSDLIAYGAYRAAAERGALAGRDYALVGFDDSPLNPWIAPWLHAVRVPYDQYGAAIAQVLRAPPGAQQDIVLSHQLIIRSAAP